MNKIFTISDHHGYTELHKNITDWIDKNHPGSISICLGDSGMGLVVKDELCNRHLEITPNITDKHWMIAGNHDDRHYGMSINPYFIGTYRYVPECDMLIIPGAQSPLHDTNHRTPFIDWFPHEELTKDEVDKCIELVKEKRPKIIVSHDGPTKAINLFAKGYSKTITRYLLDCIHSIYIPEQHIFGHHHKYFTQTIDSTKFVCRPPLGVYEITEKCDYYMSDIIGY